MTVAPIASLRGEALLFYDALQRPALFRWSLMNHRKSFFVNFFPAAIGIALWAVSAGAAPQTAAYTPPHSPRAKLNFDLNWKFIREDAPGAEGPRSLSEIDSGD